MYLVIISLVLNIKNFCRVSWWSIARVRVSVDVGSNDRCLRVVGVIDGQGQGH